MKAAMSSLRRHFPSTLQCQAHDLFASSTVPAFPKLYSALLSLAQLSTEASEKPSDLRSKLTIVPMPQLSPNMSSGKVSKWLKEPGEQISIYDVVMEISTETLSEEAYKVGDFAGTVTMLVEAQEDGYLSKILVEEGKEVSVNTPVATMCESSDTLEELSSHQDEIQKLLDQSQQLRQLTWQSYLKEAQEGQKGCS